MRWLFLFVLTLNLAFVAWQMLMPTADLYVNTQPLKNVQPIVLLSELKLQNKVESKKAVDEAIQEVAQPVAQSENTEEISPEKTAEENAPGKSTGSEQVSAQLEVKQAEETEKAEVVAVKEPEPELKPNTGTSAVLKKEPQQIPEKESCFTLGPFRDLVKLSSLTQEIKSYVVEADFRGSEEKEKPLYWVYIKPEKNRNKAIETGKRLKAKKIKDFYLIREGEKINGLSLGHFRNKGGAYGLAKKVGKLGFDVQVEVVFKTYTIYWLDYKLASGKSIPESIFDKYIKPAKKDKISRLSRDCNG